ncbi:hypothetical protein Lqui_1668 [Legionella quinlivanii]|uniref:Uncharacterized protein n=1 Tax=Legionella quinlivanii TaxID=45073 RepID=A0A0W0XZY5_9GAMM|nr:hypothetical protein [Legionella quinlivanii]KTD50343.1 hypothetical protein Lqui_1668 [Legionella quinlivanii]SEF42968.1 hypothetical protein SAMN02746093_00160 [Legionella quinlivanii DSM 21216]STY11943.1 Uncharacterised protein [Legionella quinlivanii]
MGKNFLDYHRRTSLSQPLTNIDHVITYHNGILELWGKQNDHRLDIQDSAETEALKPTYNILKSLSHNSVILDCVLRSISTYQVRTSQDELDLLNLVELLTELRSKDPHYIKPYQAAIEQLIFIADKARLSACLREIACLQARYSGEISSVNEGYLKQAAELQLTGMHQIISRWNLAFNKTRVLIAVAEGPKEDLIEGQYFDALYKVKGEDKPNLDYVVMLPKQLGTITGACLIDNLRERLLNQSIAKNMLGCPKKMARDVLGPYAPAVLERLFASYSQSSKIKPDRHSFFHQAVEKAVSLQNASCPKIQG